MKRITISDLAATLESRRSAYQSSYLAMYSSWLGGITTDPVLMLHPIDDHMVHRGDGVFETLKCVAGGMYNLPAHLDRLVRSAQAIYLDLPCSRSELEATIVDTVRAGAAPDCAFRILLSRGPGSFGVNPYESVAPQLIVIVTKLGAPFMDVHPEGARVKSSSVPAKPPFYAGIKNCNYQPNVLMAREAVDLGVDFVVSYNDSGFLAEGATENIGIVTADGVLVFPALRDILSGTTMLRVCELAETLVSAGRLSGIVFRDIRREEILAASEVLIVGTTRNVTAVCEYDDAPIADRRPGPVWHELNQLLDYDIRHNSAMRIEVF